VTRSPCRHASGAAGPDPTHGTKSALARRRAASSVTLHRSRPGRQTRRRTWPLAGRYSGTAPADAEFAAPWPGYIAPGDGAIAQAATAISFAIICPSCGGRGP
jgi:hypothetical protein